MLVSRPSVGTTVGMLVAHRDEPDGCYDVGNARPGRWHPERLRLPTCECRKLYWSKNSNQRRHEAREYSRSLPPIGGLRTGFHIPSGGVAFCAVTAVRKPRACNPGIPDSDRIQLRYLLSVDLFALCGKVVCIRASRTSVDSISDHLLGADLTGTHCCNDYAKGRVGVVLPLLAVAIHQSGSHRLGLDLRPHRSMLRARDTT